MNSTSTTRRHNPEPRAKKYACLPERGRLHAAAARVILRLTPDPQLFHSPVTLVNIDSCAITFVVFLSCGYVIVIFLTCNFSDY